MKTVRDVLKKEPKLTVSQIMTRTGLQPREVRGEITKLISRGLAREVLYVEYVGTETERGER